MKTDINKNANGDINRLANGDINRLADGDINRLADGEDTVTEEVVKEDVQEVVPETEAPAVVEVSDGTLKDKFLMKTNNIGITQDGKLTRAFGVGALTGFLLVVGCGYAKRKGWLNFIKK